MRQPENKAGLLTRAKARAARLRHRARLLATVRHLHGPRSPVADPGAVTVVAPVRDGAFYLPAFLAHYRALGAKRFVFIDNGSTDGTIDLLRRAPDAVILDAPLPWGLFENDLRRLAAERYCAGRWCLFADMDEMFDFEGSARIGLTGLAEYLTREGHTALVAQMLEMFAKAPLRDTATLPYDAVLSDFRYFDLGQIEALAYHDADRIGFAYHLKDNTLANPEIRVLFGGVRRRVFGEHCCLTKHPLVFVEPQVVPGVHPHCSAHVACTDFTALIRHYKFANDPLDRDRQSVARATTGHDEDRQRLAALTEDPGLTLFSVEAQELSGFDQLYDSGFLIRSARFAEFVSGYHGKG